MLNDPEKNSRNEPVEARCYFVRHRNALAVRADFGDLFRDYYLHLMQHQLRHEEALDTQLKDALSGLMLHLASRPRNEAVAWTLNCRDPEYNLFVTGSNRLGNITGRIFTEDIKKQDGNLFYSQVNVDGQPGRQSVIKAGSSNYLRIVEQFYEQSEQRMARIFRYSEEDLVMISAQPDCDEAWLAALTEEKIRNLDRDEELSLLEKRQYAFDCGCSLFKLLPILGNLSKESLDELFDGAPDEPREISCPRCAASYGVTREMLELYLEKGNMDS